MIVRGAAPSCLARPPAATETLLRVAVHAGEAVLQSGGRSEDAGMVGSALPDVL